MDPQHDHSEPQRQWGDMIGALSIRSGKLDIDYLQRRPRHLQVEDLLAPALREAAKLP